MCYAKWLQVIGLSSAFIGTIFLSIGVIGKDRTCKFILRWIELFKRHRQRVSLSVGIAVAAISVFSPLIDLWETPLISIIVPLMSKFPHISISISTVLTLAIVQFVIGGRASFRCIGSGIVMVGLVGYRVIRNPSRWKSLVQRLRKHVMAGFRLLISPFRIMRKLLGIMRRVISIIPIAYFYVLVLGVAISYLATSHPAWWAMSTTINLTFIITFSLIILGFFLAWCILRGLQYFASEDVEKTFRRLSFIGFTLLGFGFILQLLGIIL